MFGSVGVRDVFPTAMVCKTGAGTWYDLHPQFINVKSGDTTIKTVKYIMYLLNAFSLQMVETPAFVKFNEVEELPKGLVSAIGHADTAAVLGVECNRINVKLAKGDTAYVAQLMGGRLPEGCTTLPEGFKFKFIKVEVF